MIPSVPKDWLLVTESPVVSGVKDMLLLLLMELKSPVSTTVDIVLNDSAPCISIVPVPADWLPSFTLSVKFCIELLELVSALFVVEVTDKEEITILLWLKLEPFRKEDDKVVPALFSRDVAVIPPITSDWLLFAVARYISVVEDIALLFFIELTLADTATE